MTSHNHDRFALAISLFMAVVAVSALAVVGMRRHSGAKAPENGLPTFLGPKTESSGTEIVMIVVGSSQCGASTNRVLPAMVNRARTTLARSTEKDGKLFATVGVAIDWSIEDGMSFLRTTGPYSEVVVGRNWLNSAAVSYLWRDHSGRAALPQIIVIEREVAIDEADIHVGADRVIKRVVGLDSIRLWVDGGAPTQVSMPGAI